MTRCRSAVPGGVTVRALSAAQVALTKSAPGHQPVQLTDQKLSSPWQPGFNDNLLRSNERYHPEVGIYISPSSSRSREVLASTRDGCPRQTCDRSLHSRVSQLTTLRAQRK